MTTFEIFIHAKNYSDNLTNLIQHNWQQRVKDDLQKAGINLDDVKRIVNESLNNYAEELKTTPEAEVGRL